MSERMNVVLITIDSLRADCLGFLNDEIKREELTPNIDKLADESVIFSRAYSQGPRTKPSFPAILSGTYSSRFGGYQNITRERIMISEIMREANYNTAAFHSNPYLSRTFNYEKGFDVFHDNLNLYSGKLQKVNTKLFLFLWRIKILCLGAHLTAEEINSQVLSWFGGTREPFFLWLHYMDVHGPYVSKKGWLVKNRVKGTLLWQKALRNQESISTQERSYLIETYKEEIKYLDTHIGELLNEIDQDNTIIIITSDHGELFGEHALYGHTHNAFDALLHVPLLIKLPPYYECMPQKIDRMVKLLDIVPTITDLLEIKTGLQFDGESLRPLIEGREEQYSSDYVISEVRKAFLCVRKNKWKFVLNKRENNPWKGLFDMENDMDESNNLIDKETAIANQLEELLNNHLEAIESESSPSSHDEIVEDEAMKIRLKGLGYLD